jgi:hypothetical protein
MRWVHYPWVCLLLLQGILQWTDMRLQWWVDESIGTWIHSCCLVAASHMPASHSQCDCALDHWSPSEVVVSLDWFSLTSASLHRFSSWCFPCSRSDFKRLKLVISWFHHYIGYNNLKSLLWGFFVLMSNCALLQRLIFCTNHASNERLRLLLPSWCAW